MHCCCAAIKSFESLCRRDRGHYSSSSLTIELVTEQVREVRTAMMHVFFLWQFLNTTSKLVLIETIHTTPQ